MPNRFYIETPDIGQRFRQGMGRSYAQAGNYEGAASADPDNAQSYATMADRQTRNREREEARSYARNYAGAVHSGNYAAAGEAAARYGDVEGVTGARTARREATQQQLEDFARGSMQALAQLESFEANGGEGYAEFMQRGRTALQQNPDMDPELRRLIETAPDTYNPRFVAAVRAYATRMRDAALSPEQLARLDEQRQTRTANQRRNLTPEEAQAAGLRPGTVAQTDGSGQIYVVQSPQSLSASGSYSMLTPGEAEQMGLPPGSYQRNDATGQVTVVGRTRGQYTESASSSAQYADRMASANQTLVQLEDGMTDPTGVFVAQSGAGSEAERRVRQAQREFVNAILRRESGAVIADSEFASAAQQYFPQPGDRAVVIAQKRAARQRAIQGLINSSQGAYEEWYGDGSGAELPLDPAGVGSAMGALVGAASADRAMLERPRQIPAAEWSAMTPEERNRVIQILGRQAP